MSHSDLGQVRDSSPQVEARVESTHINPTDFFVVNASSRLVRFRAIISNRRCYGSGVQNRVRMDNEVFGSYMRDRLKWQEHRVNRLPYPGRFANQQLRLVIRATMYRDHSIRKSRCRSRAFDISQQKKHKLNPSPLAFRAGDTHIPF
ncbi:hypothetical protein RSAG8_06933, partial [Rhizoctonia solani AG-8 WAC10335]